jgi:hypothetical protein
VKNGGGSVISIELRLGRDLDGGTGHVLGVEGTSRNGVNIL